VLADLWRQIAKRFRNYGEKLVFEGFNEIRKAKSHPGPDGGEEGKDDWGGKPLYCKTVNRYAKTFYDTVRATGGNNAKRYLVIPTYAATGVESSCLAWEHPNPSDNHVMVDLHIYEPGWFCLWGDSSEYKREEFQKRLAEVFEQHKRIFIDKGVPIVCGEVNAERRYHGGDKSKPNDEDRVKWAKHFGYVARRFGCPCFIWEPGGYEGMGLIDRATVEWSHPEIIDAFNVGRKAADKKR
jgi:endoglucanase